MDNNNRNKRTRERGQNSHLRKRNQNKDVNKRCLERITNLTNELYCRLEQRPQYDNNFRTDTGTQEQGWNKRPEHGNVARNNSLDKKTMPEQRPP